MQDANLSSNVLGTGDVFENIQLYASTLINGDSISISGLSLWNADVDLSGHSTDINSTGIFNGQLSVGSNALPNTGIELTVDGDAEFTGTINVSGLPTDSTGLSTGDLWVDGVNLKVKQ